MKNLLHSIKNSISSFIVFIFYKDWIECPPNYEFVVGEKIKSKYSYIHKDGKIEGNSIYNKDRFFIKWFNDDGTFVDCGYCNRRDLLIDKNSLIKRDKMRMKYSEIDPYGEENWLE